MDGEFCYRGTGRTLFLGGILFLSIAPLCWCADADYQPNSAARVSVVFRENTPPADKEQKPPTPAAEDREKTAPKIKLSPAPPPESISITLRNPQDFSQQTKVWTSASDYSFRQPAYQSRENYKPRPTPELAQRIARSQTHIDPPPSSQPNQIPSPERKPLVSSAAKPAAISRAVQTANAPVAPTSPVAQPTAVNRAAQTANAPVASSSPAARMAAISRGMQIVNAPITSVSPPIMTAAAPVPVLAVSDPQPVQSPPQRIILHQVSAQATTDRVEPAPQPEAAPGANLPPAPAIGGAPAAANSTTAQSTQKLGEEPRNYNLDFLRRQSVLLRPCEWQLDVGVSYLYDDHYFTDVLPPSILVDERVRRRLLTVPMEFRYGLLDNVQLFANMPFGWVNTEFSFVGSDQFFNDGGIGDTNAGGSILVHKSDGHGYSPDVVTTLGFTAPTGNGNALLGILQSPETTLGQGYWAGFWSVLFIHQYDPVILYYGFGSRHYFARNINITLDDEPIHASARPGDQFNYEFGAGFAVNERITLSTTFFGSYISNARLSGEVLEGTNLEPLYLRFAITIARPPRRILEPFVELGMTNDAADARAGITWTF